MFVFITKVSAVQFYRKNKNVANIQIKGRNTENDEIVINNSKIKKIRRRTKTRIPNNIIC